MKRRQQLQKLLQKEPQRLRQAKLKTLMLYKPLCRSKQIARRRVPRNLDWQLGMIAENASEIRYLNLLELLR
jgi:hypothetical protein